MSLNQSENKLPILDKMGFIDASSAVGFSQNLLERLEFPLQNTKIFYVIFWGDHCLVSLEPHQNTAIFDIHVHIDFCENNIPKQLFSSPIDSYCFLGVLEKNNIIALHLGSQNFDDENFNNFINVLEQNNAMRKIEIFDMRSIISKQILPENHYGFIAHARSVLGWHQSHQFCANCGNKTIIANVGRRRDCTNCKKQHFPRVDPVVIMLGIKGKTCLLARHGRNPHNFSTLAGFVEAGETIEDAVRREFFEEVGLQIGKVEYAFSQPWPFVSSMMIGCYAEIISEDIYVDGQEIIEAKFFLPDEIFRMPFNDSGVEAEYYVPPIYSASYRLMKGFVDWVE